jgi:hypothetical protein
MIQPTVCCEGLSNDPGGDLVQTPRKAARVMEPGPLAGRA